jgi:PAS domain S-box-containing protein
MGAHNQNRTRTPLASNANGAYAPDGQSSRLLPEVGMETYLIWLVSGCAIALSLYAIGHSNYLLFHGLAGIFTAAVAWAVFMLVYNARRFIQNEALVFLGIAYLFIGLFDLLHALAYPGMGVFSGVDTANLATQLWISARYMESLSILAFVIVLGRSVRHQIALGGYAGVTALVLGSIFGGRVFPVCYQAGSGLTGFKIGSEYVICLILAGSLILLFRKRTTTDEPVFLPMAGAILVAIASELTFAFSIGVADLSNLMGHYLKIISFLLIYQALIRSGLTKPYAVLFRDWRETESQFRRLVETVPISIMQFDRQGVVTHVNPYHLRTFDAGKHPVADFLGRNIHALPGVVEAGIGDRLERVLAGEQVVIPDAYFPASTGVGASYQRIVAVPLANGAGTVTGGFLLREDITDEKKALKEREVSEHLLKLINQPYDVAELTRETVCMLQTWCGCQAVGLRLKRGDGFPYVAEIGFASPVDTDCVSPPMEEDGTPACVCMAVLTGRADTRLRGFTQLGSFWSNHVSAMVSDEAGGPDGFRPGPCCMRDGGESVGLIPLRVGDTVVGLLQIIDSRADVFDDAMIRLLERLAAQLAIAIQARRDVDALQQSEHRYRTLFENAPVGIFTSTTSGKVIELNPEMARMVGYASATEALAGGTDLSRQLYADPKQREAFVDRLTATGRVKGFECEALSNQGEHIWLRMDARFGESLPDGRSTIAGFSVDITPRKQVENMLRARLQLSEYADRHSLEEVLQRTLDEAERITLSRIGFFHLIKPDEKTIDLQMWSTNTLATACRSTNYRRHAPIKRAGIWTDGFYQRKAVIHNDYASLLHRKGLPPGHAPIVRQMVIPVFRDERLVALLGVGNKPIDYTAADVAMVSELVNMVWDIVVRRRIESELAVSRRDLQTLVGNLPGIAFRCRNDANWTMAYISDGCRELTGFDPVDFIDNRTLAFLQIIHPDDRRRVNDEIQAALKRSTRYALEYRIIDRGGVEKWVWERGRAVADDTGTLTVLEGFITDITDRKESERKLQMQAMVLDQIHDQVVITDLNGRIRYVNDALARFLGFDRDEMIGQMTTIFGEDPAEGASQREIFECTLTDGQWRGEVINFTKRGEQRILDCRTRRVTGTNGETIALFGISADITEKRRKENELRRLASAIDQAAESIMITDADGAIVFVNPSFERITGYRRADVLGHTSRMLQNSVDDRDLYNEVWDTLSAGHTWIGQMTNRRKDGSRYIEKGTISPVFNQDGDIINFVSVCNDVTDELQLEAKLSQAQKMEAIGTLAGGIAHDFNNILFPMVGFTEMLKEDMPAESPLQEYVADILAGALRARDLVQQILAFSRQSNQERTAIRIQHIFKETIKLTRASLPSNIEIRTNIDAACPPILADPTQIHQIIMNLITNAYHAMEPDGGVLTLTLKPCTLASGNPEHPMLDAGDYVRLSVSDTGRGIDAALHARIFEPYFTTKAEGKGTGLGLSVIHGIVTAYQGDIQVKSQPGRGTAFHILLPSMKRDSEKTAPVSEEPIQGGTERILLVDDEPPIVTMAGKMLRRLGYAVTSYTASDAALTAFRDDPTRFDLVVTDMTMPGMTGDRLTLAIKRIRPDIPVVLCTGFSNLIDETRAAELGIAGFVFKPILKRDIAETIRKALDDASEKPSIETRHQRRSMP